MKRPIFCTGSSYFSLYVRTRHQRRGSEIEPPSETDGATRLGCIGLPSYGPKIYPKLPAAPGGNRRDPHLVGPRASRGNRGPGGPPAATPTPSQPTAPFHWE